MKNLIGILKYSALMLSILVSGSALAQVEGGIVVTPNLNINSINDPTGLSKPLDSAALGSVLMVDIGYENQRWTQLDEADVIHCHAPKPGKKSDYASEIRTVDASGKPTATRFIGNPLLVLPEDPRSTSTRLDSAKVRLHIELVGNPTRIDFFEDASRQDQPSVSIDLKNALAIFAQEGGLRIPGCDHSDPPMVRVGDSQVYVLAYALDRASTASDVPADELLSMLSQYGSTIGKHVRMPAATLDLLLSSLRETGR